jgi:Ankyrin repeats (3 copies)
MVTADDDDSKGEGREQHVLPTFGCAGTLPEVSNNAAAAEMAAGAAGAARSMLLLDTTPEEDRLLMQEVADHLRWYNEERYSNFVIFVPRPMRQPTSEEACYDAVRSLLAFDGHIEAALSSQSESLDPSDLQTSERVVRYKHAATQSGHRLSLCSRLLECAYRQSRSEARCRHALVRLLFSGRLRHLSRPPVRLVNQAQQLLDGFESSVAALGNNTITGPSALTGVFIEGRFTRADHPRERRLAEKLRLQEALLAAKEEEGLITSDNRGNGGSRERSLFNDNLDQIVFLLQCGIPRSQFGARDLSLSESRRVLLWDDVISLAIEGWAASPIAHSSQSHLDVFKLILDYACEDNDSTDVYLGKALVLSSEKGYLELVKLLLDDYMMANRSFINHCEKIKQNHIRPGTGIPSMRDKTPLIAAVQGNHLEVCQVLLEHGADVRRGGSLLSPCWINGINDSPVSGPVRIAVLSDSRVEIVQLLLRYGAKPDQGWSNELLEKLLRYGGEQYVDMDGAVTVNDPACQYYRCVDIAIMKGRAELLDTLLRHGNLPTAPIPQKMNIALNEVLKGGARPDEQVATCRVLVKHGRSNSVIQTYVQEAVKRLQPSSDCLMFGLPVWNLLMESGVVDMIDDEGHFLILKKSIRKKGFVTRLIEIYGIDPLRKSQSDEETFFEHVTKKGDRGALDSCLKSIGMNDTM